MSFCFPAKLALRVSAAPQLLAKISRVIPPESAAIRARVSRGLNVVDVIVAAVGAQTAVAAVPIVVQIAVAVLPVRDSNAVLAVPAVLGTIAVIAAIPARRAVRSSSRKC